MTDAQLHELLKDNGYTLAVLKGDQVVFHSQERGLKPLYQLYRQQPELLRDSVIADKVTGKAAAVLAVLGGAKEVYSDLISEHAFQVLESGGVKTRYGGKAPYIINRTKTGMCPMETLVMDAASPEEGAARLIEFFEGLKEKQNGTEKNEGNNHMLWGL